MIFKKIKLVLLIVAIGLLAAVIVGVLIPMLRQQERPPRIYDTATILKQTQGLVELVTVKYVLQRVVVLEDAKWYGENRVVLVVTGVVKAGVDLSKLTQQDIQLNGTNLIISLPPAQITDVYIDDKNTQIVERSTGLLRKFDKDLEQNARRQAIDDLRRAARYGGILADAERQAKTQLKLMFSNLGFSVQFK
ncbi:MAG: DUF4230 domain-containing protein [Verrucomicrobiia bacterium]|jgi:hypothetical protein